MVLLKTSKACAMLLDNDKKNFPNMESLGYVCMHVHKKYFCLAAMVLGDLMQDLPPYFADLYIHTHS